VATVLSMSWHDWAADQGRKRRRRAVESAELSSSCRPKASPLKLCFVIWWAIEETSPLLPSLSLPLAGWWVTLAFAFWLVSFVGATLDLVHSWFSIWLGKLFLLN